MLEVKESIYGGKDRDRRPLNRGEDRSFHLIVLTALRGVLLPSERRVRLRQTTECIQCTIWEEQAVQLLVYLFLVVFIVADGNLAHGRFRVKAVR